MPLRGAGAGEGHHLRPKVPLPRGSPLAVWHNLTALPGIETRWDIPSPRADFVCAVETCVKLRRGRSFTVCSGASQTAIEARIGRGSWTLRIAVLFTG